ncbi:hypothetical protein [Hymenobacter bucti]
MSRPLPRPVWPRQLRRYEPMNLKILLLLFIVILGSGAHALAEA